MVSLGLVTIDGTKVKAATSDCKDKRCPEGSTQGGGDRY
jgi:hypothetical protein